jgi:RHS repeat-associated protein
MKNPKLNNNFYYMGRELEPEAGDYYYRMRYYNSSMATFLSPDPIGFRGGDSNLYRYVENNSMSFTDPEGYKSIPVIVAACVLGAGLVIELEIRKHKKRACEASNKQDDADQDNSDLSQIHPIDNMVLRKDCSNILNTPSWEEIPDVSKYRKPKR